MSAADAPDLAPPLPGRPSPLGARTGAAFEVLAAVLVAAAAAFGGGTVAWVRGALPGACAALALAAAVRRRDRVAGPPAWSAGEGWLLALALWAVLQALPWPSAIARLVAPWSVRLSEDGLGSAGGVRPSLDAGATWSAALLLSGLAALSFAVRTAARDDRGAWLQRTLCAAAIAHAAIGLAHGRYGQRDLLLGGYVLHNPLNAFGTFPNQGLFATFLLLATGPALVRWRAGGLLDRLLSLTTLAAVGAGALASHSRAGILGVAGALACGFVVAAPRGGRRRRLAVLGALAVALLVARALGVESLVRATQPKAGEGRRFEIWRGAVDLALEQPVTGVGLDAFGAGYSDPSRPIGDRGVETAEDELLEAAAEGGAVGLLLLGAGVAAAVASGRRRRRALDDEGRVRVGLGLCTFAGLVPPLLVSAPLHAPSIAAGAVLAWHAAWAAGGRSRED